MWDLPSEIPLLDELGKTGDFKVAVGMHGIVPAYRGSFVTEAGLQALTDAGIACDPIGTVAAKYAGFDLEGMVARVRTGDPHRLEDDTLRGKFGHGIAHYLRRGAAECEGKFTKIPEHDMPKYVAQAPKAPR